MNELNEKSPVRRGKRQRHGIGFFVALALCIGIIGTATWSAVKSLRSLSDNKSVSSAVSRAPVEAHTEVSGVPASSVSRTSSVASVPSENTASVSSVERKAESVLSRTESRAESVQSRKTASAATAAPKNTTFALPVSGAVSKAFGDNEYSDTFGDWRAHNGVDFSANKGSRVISIGDGTVKSVFADDLLGNVVTVDYGSGLVASYCGLEDAIPVQAGETVRCGQTVGTVGEVPGECGEESHLHLEICRNGTLVEPLAAIGHTEKAK